MIVVRRRNFLFFLIALVVICATFSFLSSNNARYPPDMMISNNFYQQYLKQCKPQDHIFFLKTHKCGSSTVQNILMRRGLRNGLNFVLPEKANYLGHPDRFHVSQIGKDLMDNYEHFDIFAHHSRFDPESVRKVMPPDTKRVTILREPSSLFESLYHYYSLQQVFKNESLDLGTLMKIELEQIIEMFSNAPRLAYRIGVNQMAFDLGFSRSNFNDDEKIAELIEMIEAEFDLILISEFMEASMVLLADLMCWPLEDLTFLTLNARPTGLHHTPLSADDKVKIRTLNKVDTVIYDHFREKFKTRVVEYGADRMMEDVARLAKMNNDMMHECVANIIEPKANASALKYYPVNRYELYNDPPMHCRELTISELKFTDFLRNNQRSKFGAKLKLDVFLHT
ncbi:galactose-3-O-sulfotransferase 4-like [Neocloeon triangulifer]|uniref:galactose-3-O-sulfotransferase 4-like n=1 Tax=Neocloeon triangulifer TaxID=2078957 RepID=UPI00286EBD78|nr:galactose-3-O-sulfotransferase 4-like [Neocloeon triangulifer]